MSRLTDKDWKNPESLMWTKLGLIHMRNEAYRTSLSYALRKLAHYEDLEDQLEKLYGNRLPLDKVVDNLNRVVQNGEEKLDLARILTNAEAEKWDRWKSLEEQGRLIELPCAVGERLYFLTEKGDIENVLVDTINYALSFEGKIGKGFYRTIEEAKAKLAEMEGE